MHRPALESENVAALRLAWNEYLERHREFKTIAPRFFAHAPSVRLDRTLTARNAVEEDSRASDRPEELRRHDVCRLEPCNPKAFSELCVANPQSPPRSSASTDSDATTNLAFPLLQR